jgi:ABC-type transport system involved in cytochrome c biogenesis permease subunit
MPLSLAVDTFIFLFFVAALAAGVWCVVAPASAIRFRQRMGWSGGILSGDAFYATERRARIMGVIILIISLCTIVRMITLYLREL